MFRGIVNGDFFKERNLANLAETDFFAWALDTSAEQTLLENIRGILTCLGVYDFDKLDGDILKELYEALVDPESRHTLGQHYTPDWLAELILDKINYTGGRLLDPACGSGTFLYAAVRRLRRMGKVSKRKLVKTITEDIIGIDIHPFAVLMAKANLLLSLKEEVAAYPHGKLGTELGILTFSFADLRQSFAGGHLGLSSNFYEDVVAVCDHPVNAQMCLTAQT